MLTGHFALPVVRVGDVADQRILFVLLQRERPGADRPVVDVFRRALFQHCVGVFGGQDRGEIHRPVGDEGGVGLAQREAHVMLVHRLHLGDQLVQAHVGEVFIVAAGDLVIRVSRILLPHHGEHHVFGVEVARWGEVFVAVEFHALAQGKGVGLAVRADAPLGGQRRGGGFIAFAQRHQAVVQHLRGGDKGRPGAGELRVERFRRGDSAVHQRIGSGQRAARRQQAGTCQRQRGDRVF